MIEYDPYNLRPPKKKRKGLSPEWKLQCTCAKIARQLARTDKEFRFEFINTEGARDPKRAGLLKMMGLERGTLEVRLYHRNKGVIRMAVGEIKSEKGRVTPEQQTWFDYFEPTQVGSFVVRSTDDFWKMVEWVCRG